MIRLEKLPPDVLSRMPSVETVLRSDSNVVFAYLFGGLASGSPRPLSDVDIAVYVADAGGLAEYRMALFDELTKALCTAEVDLVVLNTAPLSLAGRILQHKRVLVDKEPFLRHAYESRTLREFFDFRVKEEVFFKRRYGSGG